MSESFYSTVRDQEEWDSEDIENYDKYLSTLNETWEEKRSGYI